MKFCPKCGSLYFLKKQDHSSLLYNCRTCGHNETRDKSDNCIFQSDLDQQDYMTHQMSQNPYVIRDPTLPRLSNVKCINDNCLTNQSENSLILLNANNLNISLDEFIQYLQGLASTNITIGQLESSDITNYGELHTTLGNISVSNEELLETNPIYVFQLENPSQLASLVKKLKENSEAKQNLIPERFIKDPDSSIPVLSEILREVISIKYDEINMKYMYICSTCGSSWKNIT